MFAVIKKKHLLALFAVFTSVVVITVCVTVFTVSAEKKLLPIYSTDSADQVAISFDASWGSDKTKSIVDICCSYGIKPTFFLTGIWIDANEEMAKYIHEHDIEIANHSEHHYSMKGLDRKKLNEEIDSTNEKIKKITGSMPKLFRPPFGDYDNALIETLESKQMYCIQWSVDSLDWKGLSADEIVSRVLKSVEGGSIVLFHNNSDHIVEALPRIIEGIMAKGLKLVEVGSLIYKDNYKIDSQGKQIRTNVGN